MSITRRAALMAGAATLAMPYVRKARAEGAALNVYNWADYIGETTIADFQSATGIAVTYDTYSSAEEMQAKMLAGSTGYDVVDMAGLSLPRFIKAGIYDKLDRSKLPSWGNLDPEVMRILGGWDPGNQYAIPYMWGSVGITYNLDMVKQRLPGADLASLDTLFKPENAAKLADCGISILDSPTDVIPALLRYVGKDGDTANVADYQAVVELFKPVRKYIKTFDNTNYLNAIPNKELCVINNWSGDYATARSRAKDAGVDINLGYFVPKTGAPAWVDALCIPSDAKHKDSAYKFLEYMLQPEVIAKATNFTNYANGNAASKKFVDPAVLADPAVYPDEATIKRLWPLKALSEEQEREMTRAWQAIKSG
ncbi:MAG: polyamine ABC transporter substrate-binding protein [Rhizobiales bacterium]|nr:polyamine ABC transporter substrate-binding protein [Hyphomicrobiales bacterium]MBI3672450.1 polyamine ABC transporter substrate-binding protein [Hyphomicrobiales bacterium]